MENDARQSPAAPTPRERCLAFRNKNVCLHAPDLSKRPLVFSSHCTSRNRGVRRYHPMTNEGVGVSKLNMQQRERDRERLQANYGRSTPLDRVFVLFATQNLPILNRSFGCPKCRLFPCSSGLPQDLHLAGTPRAKDCHHLGTNAQTLLRMPVRWRGHDRPSASSEGPTAN